MEPKPAAKETFLAKMETNYQALLEKIKDSSFVVFGTRSFRKKRFQKVLATESLLTLQFIMAVFSKMVHLG